jgi:hypothetical protein
MTPQELQRARKFAQLAVDGELRGDIPVPLLARAVLALTEQQAARSTVTPEQVDVAADAAADVGQKLHENCYECCWPAGIHLATEAALKAIGLSVVEDGNLP